jgi:uncharacterized protein YodC (DUF2158 family)
MFKVGDVVELKSGSPQMTVQSVSVVPDCHQVKCVFFWQLELRSYDFPADALVKVECDAKNCCCSG